MSPTPPRRTLDVSGLPGHAFGHRAPLWWGGLGLVAIEGTMLALLAASWFYVRGNFRAWPPVDVGARVRLWAALEVIALAASAAPNHLLCAAALRGDLRAIRRWLAVVVALGVAYLAFRWRVFADLPFPWHRDAYASVLWAALVLNAFHGISGVAEDVLLLALALAGPFEEKHRVDVQVGGLLWYFVVGSWIPLWFLLVAAPGLLRR